MKIFIFRSEDSMFVISETGEVMSITPVADGIQWAINLASRCCHHSYGQKASVEIVGEGKNVRFDRAFAVHEKRGEDCMITWRKFKETLPA